MNNLLLLLLLIFCKVFSAEYSDNFNRASLGADWTTIPETNALTILSSDTLAGSTDYARNGGYLNTSAISDSQFVSAVVYYGEGIGYTFVAARVGESGTNCYFAGCNEGSNNFIIGKYIDGTFTSISDAGITFNSGSTAGFLVRNDTLISFVDGTPVDTATDSDLSSGHVGVIQYKNAAYSGYWDNFYAVDNYHEGGTDCDSVYQVGFTDSLATQLIYKATAGCTTTDTIRTVWGDDTTSLDTNYHAGTFSAGDTIRDTMTALTPSTKYYAASIDSMFKTLYDTAWTRDSLDSLPFFFCAVPTIDSISGPDSVVVGGDIILKGQEFKSADGSATVGGESASITNQTDVELTITCPSVADGSREVVFIDSCGNMDSVAITVYIETCADSLGVVWSDLGQQYSQTYIYALERISDSIVVAGTASNGKILRSTDAGATWSDLGQQASQAHIFSIAALNDSVVIAGTGTGGRMIRSTNMGATWSDLGQQFSQGYILSLAKINDSIALAGTGTGGKILRSTNAGATWSDLGQQASQTLIYSIEKVNDSVVVAGTAPNGKILRSTDAGATWSDLGQQFSQGYIYALKRVNDTMVIAGTASNGKILRSTDAGATWSDLGQQASQTAIYSLGKINDSVFVAGTGTGGKILRSTDAGATWSDLGQQASESYIYSFAKVNDSVALAGTASNGKILRSVYTSCYVLTLTNDGHGTTSPISDTTIPAGTYANITATPSVGYENAQWSVVSGDGSFNEDSSRFTPTSDATILASFPIKTYTITYDANGGSGSITDESSPYDSNAVVTVLSNSFTMSGYDFSEWNTAANGSGTSYDPDDEFNISANTTLYAQWQSSTPQGATYIQGADTLRASTPDVSEIKISLTDSVTDGNSLILDVHTFDLATLPTISDNLSNNYQLIDSIESPYTGQIISRWRVIKSNAGLCTCTVAYGIARPYGGVIMMEYHGLDTSSLYNDTKKSYSYDGMSLNHITDTVVASANDLVLSYLVTVTSGISVTAGPGFTLRHDVHSEDAIDSWDEDSIAAAGDSVVASWINAADPSAVWLSISTSFASVQQESEPEPVVIDSIRPNPVYRNNNVSLWCHNAGSTGTVRNITLDTTLTPIYYSDTQIDITIGNWSRGWYGIEVTNGGSYKDTSMVYVAIPRKTN
jgi:photosystem II stability/assembly factor-like uncharacterized protein